MNTGLGDKVYSPDMQVFDLDGKSGIINTLTSVVIGPIRLLLRTVHNILILPSNLTLSYAEGLLIVGGAMEVLGIIDLLLFSKWVLAVSQIPIFLIAFKLKKSAQHSIAKETEKREVEINTQSVETLCNEIHDILENIVEGNSETESNAADDNASKYEDSNNASNYADYYEEED